MSYVDETGVKVEVTPQAGKIIGKNRLKPFIARLREFLLYVDEDHALVSKCGRSLQIHIINVKKET